jgi:dipeptidyl aminopeptidase/acylaminoacyl peptidase
MQICTASGRLRSLKRIPEYGLDPPSQQSAINSDGHSEPKLIRFPTGNKEFAYGFFYSPFNRRFIAPAKSRPPLLVLVHGGPTSKAISELASLKQYFCSLGYALLDVNHRGSTGHGRKYRQSLLGNWGEFDAEDITSGIRYVVEKGWVDGELVFIRGGSAGGYAVLRSLTRYPEKFAGGACYYGIGNLITLSEITHKFEAKYTDQLIGEVFDREKSIHPESKFVKRSPIFQIEKLSSPIIMFQGLDDKVVPPDVSREVVEVLKERKIKHSYTEYSGEGHGFRQAATRIDALRKETMFFSEIIRAKSVFQK